MKSKKNIFISVSMIARGCSLIYPETTKSLNGAAPPVPKMACFAQIMADRWPLLLSGDQ